MRAPCYRLYWEYLELWEFLWAPSMGPELRLIRALNSGPCFEGGV